MVRLIDPPDVIADRSWVDLGLQTSEILSGHLPPLRHALL
jgi:hypothetical protein